MPRMRRGGAAGGVGAGDMDALFRQVDAAYRTDPRQALRLVERALRAGRPEDAPLEVGHRARLIRMRAHVRRALNDFAGALDDYRAVLAHYRRTKDPLEVAITQIGRVDALMYRGRYAEALRAAAQARRVFLRRGDVLRAARLDSNVGNVYHRSDRPIEGLRHYDRARAVFQALDDRLAVAMTDLNRGNVLSALGRFDAAEAAYAAARPAFAERGQDLVVAQVDYNRAYLPFLQERLTEALAAFDAVQPRLGRLGERRHESLCLMDSAEILLRLNHPVEAEERARRAASGFQRIGLRYEEARSLAFQGTALFRLGRFETARGRWRRSRTLFARESNTLWQGVLELGMARLELRLGRIAAARNRLAAARGHLARPGVPADRRAELLLVEGLVASARGDDPGSRFRQALRLARRAAAAWLIRDIEEALGDRAHGAGRGAAARKHYAAAVAAGERLRALVSGDDFRATFFRDRSRPYLALAFLELESGRTAAAWDWVERGRARALLEGLDDLPRPRGKRQTPQTAELEALLRRLAAQYHQENSAALGTRPASETTRLPDTVRQHLESRAESLLRTLHPDWSGAAGARSASGLRKRVSAGEKTGRVRPEDVAPPLLENEAFVSYVEFNGGLSAFVRTRHGLSCVSDLADTATIDAAAERLAYQWGRFRLGPELYRRHDEALLADALEDLELLQGLLVAPLREALGQRSWIVSPCRSLATLPFGALFDGRRFLVEDRSLSIAPSLGVFARCRKRAAGPIECAVLLGQSGADSPEVRREVSRIRRRLKGFDVRHFEGPAATVAAFEREAGGADYLHLASHGFFHRERPRLSGIRLADRWLHAHDVARTQLKARLVVLSACQSGVSEAREGEDWLGMARAFLKSGAARVLASLWDVEDHATRELMTAFVTALGTGTPGSNRGRGWAKRPPAEALRIAQVTALARRRHPWFWAGFQLVGAP